MHYTPSELAGLVVQAGRRSFTKQITLACIGLVALPALALGGVQERKKLDDASNQPKLSETTLQLIRTLTRSRFAAVLNDNFVTIYGAGDTYILQLVEISDVPMPAPARGSRAGRQRITEDERERSFVLRFRGALDMPLPQNTYKLRHPLLGEHEIFLVPVGQVKKENGARFYEAIFNRHIE